MPKKKKKTKSKRKFSKKKVDYINNPIDALIGGP